MKMQIIQAMVLAAIAISGVVSAPPPPQTVSNVVSGRGPPHPPPQKQNVFMFAIYILCRAVLTRGVDWHHVVQW
jgi:hypothetical protein